MKKNLLAVLLGCIFAAILVEVFFRILPVSDSLKTLDVTDKDPYMRFEQNREVRISRGKFFEIRADKRTNRQGFFDNRSFKKDTEHKKLVIIGDSYVEAAQVRNEESIHGRLDSYLKPTYEVYGVGASGSPLSQYVAYARYVREELDPDAYVFNIVSNDYDESLLRYNHAPGYHFYNDNLELQRVDSQASLLKKLLRHSAATRYFMINLEGYTFAHRVSDRPRRDFVANVAPDLDEERVLWSKKAADKFLADISKICREKTVIILVDGLRQFIYSPPRADENKMNYPYLMNDYLMRQAKENNFIVIDLHPIFELHYKNNFEKFEFESDWHWNQKGHEVAARAVENVMKERGLLN